MTTTTQLLYQGMVERHGPAYARRWLASQRGQQTPQQLERADFAKTAAAALEKAAAATKPEGGRAIRLARELTAPDAQALGVSYPLVLACVTAALEAGHDPEDRKRCNGYHMGATFDTLGWMAARVEERPKPFCAKTVQRWLHPSAPHAAKLREWLAWKPWYTDTMQNYSTGESIGPVVGCHVVRVNTQPLRNGKLAVMGDWLRKQWRNLQADIRAGRTARARSESRTDVHIERTTQRDAQAANFYFSDWQQHPPGEKSGPLSEHYIYPDIKTPAGAAQLRRDVQTAAGWLAQRYGCTVGQYSPQRYLNAVWVAVKHDLINDNPGARRLLMQGVKLAGELHSDPNNTLKSPDAYVWSLLENRGFREYRRDVPPRLFQKSLFNQVMLM